MKGQSLTGDAVTDALVPIAMRLAGAVRSQDAAAVDEAFADAILATGGRCDPGQALAVVCAAMVPDDSRASTSLLWLSVEAERDRLAAAGVSHTVLAALLPADDGNKKGAAA